MEINLSFNYDGNKEIIKSNIDEYMKNIFYNFANKVQKKINNLFFLYNGNIINGDSKLSDIIKKKLKVGKNQKMHKIIEEIKILVYEYDYEESDNYKDTIKQSKHIICPICNELCIINFSDYKINLICPKNSHYFSNILLEEFNEFQNIDQSKILCNKCSTNKSNTIDEQFYKCCDCKINLCPLCKSIHNSKHLIKDYDTKDFSCNIHGERNILYCEECNMELCDLCGHEKHNCTFLYRILKNNNLENNELKEKINKLKDDGINILRVLNKEKDKDENQIIIKKITKLIENIEIFYKITNNYIINYNIRNKNSILLKNINFINDYNKMIIKDIEKIINEQKFENKLSYISDIYSKMIIQNEITIKYKIGNEKIIRIFGESFVKKNTNNFKLIINNKSFELTSSLDINDIETNNEILEIKLKQIKTVTDISFMFSDCTELLTLENILNWEIKMLIIWNFYFIIAKYYLHYQIYLIGIQIMLLK